jgi:hypothetical protein
MASYSRYKPLTAALRMCVKFTQEKFLTPSANIPEIVRAKVSTGHEVRRQTKICSSMTRPQDRIRRVSAQTLLTAAYFQSRNLGQKSNQDEFKKNLIPLSQKRPHNPQGARRPALRTSPLSHTAKNCCLAS